MKAMNEKIFVILTLMLAAFGIADAQVSEITVRVKDKLTNLGLRATVLIMSEDSLTADGTDVNVIFPDYIPTNKEGILKFKPPKNVMLYHLIVLPTKKQLTENNEIVYNVSFDDFEPKDVRFTVPPIAKGRFEAPDVYLERKKKLDLDEVTVTASKVKFYYKGDTLIYNANAFMLSDGSMLDGLLAQMPGVKIDSNGKISVNNHYISELLLDGKDVFNSKTQVMLENIGAYMIKDIAVYNKANRESKLMGRKVGEDPYVMDVRLKREYAQGWVVNAEGGYGTEDRYLGRLFGMWYSEYVALTVYGGANNLSDERTPGRDDKTWSVTNMGRGAVTRQQGGTSYLVRGDDERYELKGSVEATNCIDDNRTSSTTEWYQQQSNLYEYNWRGERIRQYGVETQHKWFAKLGERVNLHFEPQFKYENRNQNYERLTATLREKIDLATHDGIAAIYSASDTLKDKVINKMKEEQTEEGKNLSTQLDAISSIKLIEGDNAAMLRLRCWVKFAESQNKRFDRYRLAYSNATSSNEYHRYYKFYPDFDREMFGEVQYVQFTDFLDMESVLTYNFTLQKFRRTSDMYALDRLPGYDFDTSGLDLLPPRDEYL
ncbi:MAG: hypothetical protein K2H33_07970, partial [Muribaculaceae bacterium]|nr:hypothetical protein [Muribaculaceae bacterium]